MPHLGFNGVELHHLIENWIILLKLSNEFVVLKFADVNQSRLKDRFSILACLSIYLLSYIYVKIACVSPIVNVELRNHC